MAAELIFVAQIMLTLVFSSLFLLFIQLYNVILLKGRRLRWKLKRQDINGPSPSLLYGNIHEMKSIQAQIFTSMASSTMEDDNGVVKSHAWPSIVFPHLEQWRNEYGPVFMYSTGSIHILCITDTEMAKEVSLCTSLNLGKPLYLSTERGPLLGQGILASNGKYWSQQRKIIAPEFYLDKVKDTVSLMVESTARLLQSWGSKAESSDGNVEIRVDEDMRALSADIISRACFGSSYAEGEKIFSNLRTLQKVMSKSNIGVPGLRHVPNKHNKEIWRLEKEIETAILKVVQARSRLNSKKDLLRTILEAAKSSEDNTDQPDDNVNLKKFVVDNCKNIYFAGHETTAISASWCLMLLAAYPDWQARARAEVVQICGNNSPNAEMIRSMKTLTMVIQETLRLYSPVAFVVREALQDISIKGIQIPQGINLQIPIPMLHRHTDLWGPDAHQFNPTRFTEGTARACKFPQAYMPFGLGNRSCIGQHFAMTELKVILSLVLSRFSFSLAPSYSHRPVFRLVIEPGNGITLNIKRL